MLLLLMQTVITDVLLLTTLCKVMLIQALKETPAGVFFMCYTINTRYHIGTGHEWQTGQGYNDPQAHATQE